MYHIVTLSCALLFLQSAALATAPRSTYTSDTNTSVTSQSLVESDSSTAGISTARLRDSSTSNKYDSSFVRNENRDITVGLISEAKNSNQTDGTLSLPTAETGSTNTYVGSMRDLWAGSNDGELIHLTESTITQSGNGIALITANTPLPGAVWLGLLGLSAIGVTRYRKESV